jgi:carbonic anhydrase
MDSDAALRRLNGGNGDFAALLDHVKDEIGIQQIIPVDPGDLGLDPNVAGAPKQRPFAAVLGCSDARVPIELIFNEGPNDLFVIRVAGNGLGTEVLGSLKYAVEHLGARLIVVLGHERCGAVTAALESSHAPGHINSLVRDIQPAVKAAKGKPGDALDATIIENAHQVAAQIKAKAELGELSKEVRIVSGVYDLDTGKVLWASEHETK